MTSQPPGPGPDAWYAHPTSTQDWTSPLWARPDTVASTGLAPQTPAAPGLPPLPPAPAPRRSRGLLVAATAALLVAVLVVGALLAGAIGRTDTDTAAALPTPAATGPAVPRPVPSPSAPALVPPGPGAGQGQPGGGGSAALTPQQQAAVAAVSPALVDIVSTIGFDNEKGAGTGVVLSSDGIVLTNHHVVAGATAISVTDVGNGQTYSATVLGYDRSHDVAVLRLSGASGLATAPIGDSGSVAVGDSVVAVGNAGGVGGTPAAVAGSVTALDRTITAQDSANGTAQRLTGLIQVDADIQPGDSGGALVSADGKVVGIITAGSVSTVGRTASTEGYAIPMATAHSIAGQILSGQSSGTVHIGGTAFLGISVGGLGVATSSGGVTVARTLPGSAAERAGIAAGDVITRIDGTAVAKPDELTAALGTHHPGDSVTVTWTDTAGTDHTAKVVLGTGPVG